MKRGGPKGNRIRGEGLIPRRFALFAAGLLIGIFFSLFLILGIVDISSQDRAGTPKWDRLVQDFTALADDFAGLEGQVERNPEGVSKKALYKLQSRAGKINIEARYATTWNEEPTTEHKQRMLDSANKIQLAEQKIRRYQDRMAE